MSVPTPNSIVMMPRESMLCDESFVTPSTLVSCSSCSITISCSTSCGLAPGQLVSTVIVGICTSGVSCIGIRISAIDAEQRDQQHADRDFHRIADEGFDRDAWVDLADPNDECSVDATSASLTRIGNRRGAGSIGRLDRHFLSRPQAFVALARPPVGRP